MTPGADSVWGADSDEDEDSLSSHEMDDETEQKLSGQCFGYVFGGCVV